MSVSYSTSWIEICNAALGRLGKGSVADLEEGSQLAKYCKLYLGQAIDEVFSLWEWSFCRSRAQLNQLADTPAFGPAYYYQLPIDFVRPISVDSDEEDWSIEGERLATDGESVDLVYLARPEDPAKIPGYANRAISTRLALCLTTPLTSSETLSARIKADDTEAVSEAIAADSRRSQGEATAEWYGNLR